MVDRQRDARITVPSLFRQSAQHIKEGLDTALEAVVEIGEVRVVFISGFLPLLLRPGFRFCLRLSR